MRKIMEKSARAAMQINPLTNLVLEATERAIKNSNDVTKSGDIEELKAEAMRQEITLKMAKEQARVSQEIAIARRIDTADEVIIEEFYDTSGDAGLGLKSNGQDISIGLNGSGKLVTKRVYRFKGWRDIELDDDYTLNDDSYNDD